VRKLRAERGWTVEQLGEVSGISPALLSAIERGDRPNPTLETLRALADTFGVLIDDIAQTTPIPLPQELEALVGSPVVSPPLTAEEAQRIIRATQIIGGKAEVDDYLRLLRILRANPRLPPV
jgi:transcriptional regulator with XRE-family HTH domain